VVSGDREDRAVGGRPRRRPTRNAAAERGGQDYRERRSRTGSAGSERPRRRSLKAADVARLARRQVQDMTGKDPEGVTSLERSDGGWLVAVEVVEAHRIPNTTDILAVYEAELDDDGDLVSYRRVDRYARGQGEQR
jgi:gas vesicle protein GvpO